MLECLAGIVVGFVAVNSVQSVGGSGTPGVPALFSWADVDGDGRLELAALSGDGKLRLLVPAGGDRFEDATERLGLAGVEDAALVLWADYDADGRIDLFVGARAGRSRLFRNAGGVLEDWSEAAGLALDGAVTSATWLDHDGDTRLDLAVVTTEGSALCMSLFRGLEGGFFERTELTGLAGTAAELPAGTAVFPIGSSDADTANDRTPDAGPAAGSTRSAQTPAPGTPIALGSGPSIGNVTPLQPFPSACASSVKDQATPATCLQASTTPTLGRLYPISSNLFVALTGEVGIGTTSPVARLDVAGTARITDTLTLAPPGDQALAINAGSIYKNGALFLHTHGSSNTGVGREALLNVTGSGNTAIGHETLRNNTTGNNNTAGGFQALLGNTTGSYNTATGRRALSSNTAGGSNTAVGSVALTRNTTGNNNTASGGAALYFNTTGNANTATGASALLSNTAGNNNAATGISALTSNTTGNNNSASGAYALGRNTTGSFNTASGYSALYSNTTGGDNTASGSRALYFNSTGFNNTASGTNALRDNTTGRENTASGWSALRANTTGYSNTATGNQTLDSNTTGLQNTASGHIALYNNTTGNQNTVSGAGGLASNTTGNQNTGIGWAALLFNTTGQRNIAVGEQAGRLLTTGSDNIAIGNVGVAGEFQTIRIGTAGTHTRAFIAGIRGATTGVANGIPVLIDSNGQLGTISSSRRFKEEIQDMGDATERLLALRPVVFRYKPEVQAGERPLEYGLIAEEVAEVFPELVVFDEEGKPFTVKYHLLSSMLLNELQRLSAAHGCLAERDAARESELADLRERLESLEAERRDTTPAAPAAGKAGR